MGQYSRPNLASAGLLVATTDQASQLGRAMTTVTGPFAAGSAAAVEPAET